MIITKRTREKLLERDETTFQMVYEEYESLVYYICYSITFDRTVSEDLVQDVFLKMLASIESYNETGKFKEWLSQIARNIAKNYVMRKASKKPVLQEEQIDFIADTSNTNRLIYTIQGLLTFEEADIVILKIVYNMKFREIANSKDMTIHQVQDIYYKALNVLKEKM